LIAGLIFLLHPTAVETVAWASAFPYVLSLSALLLSFLAYVNGRRAASIAGYAASLLARPTALGYPLILLVVDCYPLDRCRRIGATNLLVEKAPFAALAVMAGAAEWQARDIATLQDVGLGARLTLAASAPLLYLRRIFWPVALSPLDPLPIAPAIEWAPLMIGVSTIVVGSVIAWRARDRWPLGVVAWICYLVLIAPVAGLTPSGLQATADRYLYVPSVVVAIAIGVAVAGTLRTRSVGVATAAATIGALLACAALTWRQVHYWNNSVTLWTRATAVDPTNDVATYNLAIALADAGRDEDAIRWYERTLTLVPDHNLARRNLAIVQAAAAERRADQLATSGRADEAADEYARALALDAKRSHARAARGMLMMKSGRLHDAIDELRLAVEAGVKDAEVANALGFALAQTGDAAQAVTVLSRAVADHPDSVSLEHNLARLLATTADPRVRDATRALALARDVCSRTGNRDPRALDTLAAAYAGAGRFDEARDTAARAADAARDLGDRETAAEIEAHARRYRERRR
jgi:protein O-mannosyl-transferase